MVITASPRPLTNYAKVVNGPAWYPRARVRTLGWVNINGRRMRSVYVPPATNDGSAFMHHVVLIWTEGGHTYAIGFHNTKGIHQTLLLDEELAKYIKLVQRGGQRSSSSPRLTRNLPPFVTHICKSERARSPLPLVCPPLVPVTRNRPFPGLSGVLLGNTNIPRVKPPADRIYLVAFNGGDSGPTYWHWIAGMGTPQAIHYWVLSDARNEVKGRPKRVKTVAVERRQVEIWRFPDYPAGGEFGGHFAAITRSGPYLAIASIHGYENAGASARMVVALARKADAAR